MLLARVTLFITLLSLHCFCMAGERNSQICVKYTDPSRTVPIANKLDELSIPFSIEKNIVCVSDEYEGEFHRIRLSFESNPVQIDETIKVEISPNGIPLDVITIENIFIRAEFINELKSKDIWHKIGAHNDIFFEFKDRARSRNLYLDAADKPFPPGNSIGYFTELAAERLRARLEENEIVHAVRKLNSETYVVWNATDDASVRTILSEFAKELERRRNEIMTTVKSKKEFIEKITALYDEFGYESVIEANSEQ